MGWQHFAAAVSFAYRLLAAAGIFVAPVQALHVKVVAPVSLVAALLACPSGDYGMATFRSGCLVYFASISAASIFVAPVQVLHAKVIALVSLVAALLASPSGDYRMATFSSSCFACFAFTATDSCWCWVGSSASAAILAVRSNTRAARTPLGASIATTKKTGEEVFWHSLYAHSLRLSGRQWEFSF